ncbi:MAG: DHH family phosphoesterase [Clostridiales Family XIII bacterium]|jgi:c-di-AMP phosphodiesterase-like protein|nr:DHH family phosphoesterase [Clostridiales Family XIII bacterium]
MGDRIVKKISDLYIKGGLAAIAVLALLLFLCNKVFIVDIANSWVLLSCAVAVGLLYTLFFLITRILLRRYMEKYLDGLIGEIDETTRYATRNHPLPLCLTDADGVVTLANARFRELYPAVVVMKTNIVQLTGKYSGEFSDTESQQPVLLSLREQTYKVLPVYLDDDARKSVMLCYIDVTDYENLKTLYSNERKCFAHVQIDNYDELISSSPDDKKSLTAAGIEKTVRQWAAKMNASVVRYYSNKYFIVFDYSHYKRIATEKFGILDEARAIETDADFPVSLSIGVGLDGKTPQQTDEYATFALDLALGRGGDQAVVKRGMHVDYYGGTLQMVERRNKGKSRVMAHAIRQLMDQSSKVIVMGHKNPDIDSFAASVGVARIAMNRSKDAFIVIGELNRSLAEFQKEAHKSGEYAFIGAATASDIIDKNTLLVVVDTHRPSLTEAPALLGKTEKSVVIDHHRKAEEYIENATLNYMEPAASSTSELIAEIMQYMAEKKSISRLEAEMLLGGIIVDTNSFSVKTGTRTFEAASWLRRNGADTAVVRQYLQSDMEDFRQRANIISNAEFLSGGIAISRNEGRHENAQIINAKAADELLDIKGIRASFVVGETGDEVVISARSLGEINVQQIMERLGGGGHLTTAAAQIKGITADEATAGLRNIINDLVTSRGVL